MKWVYVLVLLFAAEAALAQVPMNLRSGNQIAAAIWFAIGAIPMFGAVLGAMVASKH